MEVWLRNRIHKIVLDVYIYHCSVWNKHIFLLCVNASSFSDFLQQIGDEWVKDLFLLRKLTPQAANQGFLRTVFQVKQVRPGAVEGGGGGGERAGRVMGRGKGEGRRGMVPDGVMGRGEGGVVVYLDDHEVMIYLAFYI